jgi:glucose/mannose-6-phosphate isomerase
LKSAAIRFKNSLQENGKIHVITEEILETCHNGIISWEQKSNVQPVLLEGQDDHSKTKERWEIIKEFFSINDIDYFEIKSNSGNILSKIICLIYLLDYCSIYFAALSGIDPTHIKSIDFVKKRL